MRIAFFILCFSALPVAAQNLEVCGPIDQGARDYRRMTAYERAHIEGAHFTREVEQLKRGKTGEIGGDLDYTLRHMPNNPRALMAISKLGARLKSERIPGAVYSVECYFHRAVRFAPDDPMVRFTFGHYLLGKQNKTAARAQLEAAAQDAGSATNLHYNLGLAFLDLGDVEAAQRHAKIAYESPGQPPGLANRLKKMGAWQDPQRAPPPTTDDIIKGEGLE